MSKTEMEFTIHSTEKIINHWMLQKTETVDAIIKTPQWLKDHKLVARVTVNDIELSFEDLDAFLMDSFARIDKERAEKYSDLDREAQRRAEKILQERADGVLELMDRLTETLRDAGTVIKPYWET